MDAILTHTHADFDALGAAIGARRLYPGAVIALPPALDANVARFVGLYRDALGLTRLADLDPAAVSRVILVDTQDPQRAGNVKGLVSRSDLVWEVYDHHPPSDRCPPARVKEVRSVGSASTIFATKLKAADVRLTPPEATGMLLGVFEDTGRLSFSSTTPEDAEAVAYLLTQGARLDQIADYLDPPLDPVQQELLTAILDHMETVDFEGGTALLAGLDFRSPLPECSLLLERLMALYRPTLAVLAIRAGDFTQLVGRSRSSETDLKRLLAPWNAKGHPCAVSAHDATGPDPKAIVAEVRARLEGGERLSLSARDVMSSPVRGLAFHQTAREALEEMRRWGHTAMPVLHNGRVQGMISRRDLDRAIHHGFGERSIKGLVARRIETVQPDTPIAELRERMIAFDIGRLPVVDGDQLIGIVTRSDLIRELDREPGRLGPRPGLDLAERIARLWPAHWQTVLETVGKVAGDRPAYLIGGSVRDLVLERPSFDIDVMIEGSALDVARDLAHQIEGVRVKPHEAFGTAHVVFPGGERLDLAMARIEHYPHPGALPVVSPATLKQDLSRRDFTVNALAMRINPGHFGEVSDYFGGLLDLETRTIRVLHPISFIEDPVRLFRAARFEQKLGFVMDPVTESYGHYAMASGRFDGMANERLKLELRLGLCLSRVAPLCARLSELGAWRMLSATLALTPETSRRMRRFDRLMRSLRPADQAAPERWLTPLALLVDPLEAPERSRALDALNLRKDERAILEAAHRGTSMLSEQSKEWEARSDAELARLLEGMPDEALWAMAASTASSTLRRRLWRYATVLRHLRLQRVDGDWLKARGLPPGPRYKEILGALLDARRSGELETPEAEEAFAHRLITDRSQPVL
ncbi:CBS domain-containing protein [bacterium]|nr:CBS domain-containing protein [bacterium]